MRRIHAAPGRASSGHRQVTYAYPGHLAGLNQMVITAFSSSTLSKYLPASRALNQKGVKIPHCAVRDPRGDITDSMKRHLLK